MLDPEKVISGVGARLYELRTAAGWTQEQAAARLRCSVVYVRALERGRNLTLYSLTRLANLYGVSPGDLLQERPPRKRKPGRPRGR